MWISVDGYVYEGDRQLRGVDGNDNPVFDPEAPERPGLDYVWDSSLEGWVLPFESLPVRLERILDTAARSVSESIANGTISAPPVGTFAGIAQLSAALKELAQLVPVSLYAPEALAAVTALGALPEPMEAIRQTILAEINNEINTTTSGGTP